MLKITVEGIRGEGKSCLVTMLAGFLKNAGHTVYTTDAEGHSDVDPWEGDVENLRRPAEIRIVDTSSEEPRAVAMSEEGLLKLEDRLNDLLAWVGPLPADKVQDTLLLRLKKLEAFESRFGQWDEMTVKRMVAALSGFEQRLKLLDGPGGRIEQTFQQLAERLSKVEGIKTSTELEDRIGQLERLLMNKPPKRGEFTETSGVIQRVEQLEALVGTIRGKYNGLSGDLAALSGRIPKTEPAEELLTKTEEAIRVVETTVTVLQQAIQQNEQLRARLSNLEVLTVSAVVSSSDAEALRNAAKLRVGGRFKYPGNDPENGPAEWEADPRAPSEEPEEGREA